MECVRILLDAGAEVNGSGNNGATALMWGTGDSAKVRLLLERGAAVNAKTKDGTTALVTAARRGNTDSVRLLIAQGADPKASENNGAGLLRIAYLSNSSALRKILMDAGVEVKEPGAVGPDATFAVGEPGASEGVFGSRVDPRNSRADSRFWGRRRQADTWKR